MAPVDFTGPPVQPRDAATVVLVRDGEAGLEAFLLRRVAGMAFAGGMTVFPGGGVDRRDADTSVAWSGPPPSWWASRFGCSVELATALVCAAVRETFEESGVLLAGPSSSTVVGDTSVFAAARAALVARELSLAQFLAAEGLVLRADLLRPWANWLTPVEEPRRYDTYFFVAVLPTGQRADGATTEASDAAWQRPADAMAEWKAGRRALMPPTWVTLAELDELGTVAAVLAESRTVSKVIPKLVREGDVLRVVVP
ncbi:NUDIX hydrolase [Saccharothrix saharensis]|uniref:NUDIX hydrolase n=1 Tax=Saccharothrix saharensis TaxID=571190 RepID=UPI0036932022